MLRLYMLAYNTGVSFFNISSEFIQTFVSSNTEVQSVVQQWLGQQPASFFASGIQKLVDRSNYLNELGQYVKKETPVL